LYRNVFQKLFFVLLAFLLSGATSVFAEDDSLEGLGFIAPAEETVVSTPRSPRPSSKIAENITVISADDISRLNAHTLADVLQTVPGIQLDYHRTPSTFTFFNIQGALNTTVMVLIDGIRQNDFDQNIALPGLIPVQQIERIEIIKGAASAAWGSALGGVINIVTKNPNPERSASGMVSGSIGSKFTADSRAELSGSQDNFGYYLTVGHLRSDGLSPNTATAMNSLYGKFSFLLPDKGTVTFGLSHLRASPGLDEADTASWGFVHDNNENRRTNSFLNLNQPLGGALNLDISGYITDRDDHAKYGGRDGQGAIAFYSDYATRDSSIGTNIHLTWGDGQKNLTTGFEFVRSQASYKDLLSSAPPSEYTGYDLKSWDRWALYSNGVYSIGNFSLLPGIRYDSTGLFGDNLSYTLGATYQISEKTTLRAYGAEGYSLPFVRVENALQKVKTVQSGIESGAVPYLWLKGTYFYNTLRNSQSAGVVTTTTNQNRQGFEVEARTTPFFNLSLASGYTYLYATDSDTGKRLQTDSGQSVPPHLVKLALNYNNSNLGLRGAVTGNYVWWNASADTMAKDGGMIWDLHLSWKLCQKSQLSPELFFSGHNLFNGVQTTDTELYKNAGRWFDGGLRVSF
jgi:vitamin B12 transporter